MKLAGFRFRQFAAWAALGLPLALAIVEQGLSADFQSRPSIVSIELENLVNATKASGGQVVRQEMQGFGSGWSGAQLFWRAPAPVDAPMRNWPHLNLTFTVPAEGQYEVILLHTVAPDFGTYRVFLDGEPVGDIDGYAPGVAPRVRSLGPRKLKEGSHPAARQGD